MAEVAERDSKPIVLGLCTVALMAGHLLQPKLPFACRNLQCRDNGIKFMLNIASSALVKQDQ